MYHKFLIIQKKKMYHIVPEIGFSNYIIVYWDCHGVMRLVYPTVIYYSTTVRSSLPDGLVF